MSIIKHVPLTSTYIEKNTMEVKGAHQQFGYRHSSKCHLLFSRRKKLTQFWNYIIIFLG